MSAIVELPQTAEHFGYTAGDPLMNLLMQAVGGDGLVGEVGMLVRASDYGRRLPVLNAETLDELKLTEIGPDKIHFLDAVYWGGEGRRLLGVPVTDLVAMVPVPERMLHESMHAEIAKAAAEDLRLVMPERGEGETGHNVLEIGTGIGSFTHALLEAGFVVWETVERNADMSAYTQAVWQALELTGVTFVVEDGWELLKRKGALYRVEGLSAIVSDPPWDGRTPPTEDGYDFALFGPDGGEDIIANLLKAAPVAALKLPGAFRDGAVAELVEKMNESSDGTQYSYTIFLYELTIGDRVVAEKMLVVAEVEDMDNAVVRRELSYTT